VIQISTKGYLNEHEKLLFKFSEHSVGKILLVFPHSFSEQKMGIQMRYNNHYYLLNGSKQIIAVVMGWLGYILLL
jgi:hypothetical protein